MRNIFFLILFCSFVQQYNAQHIVWATYLGGNGTDEPGDITVDALGNLYITGKTSSLNFPATPEAVHNTLQSNSDGFVVKFNPDGELVYSGFLGTGDDGGGADIEVDNSGILVGGYTHLSYFYTSEGAYSRTPLNYQSTYSLAHPFLLKFNPEGTQFLYSTYFWGNKIDLDNSGDVYITGTTNSSALPTTANAYDRSNNGGMDIFVAKLNSSLSSLLFSTYLGGSKEDGRDSDILVDSEDNVYVAATTYSSDYPVSDGAFDLTFEENEYESDIVITKLNSDAGELLYSTYLGCSRDDSYPSISVNNEEQLYITGITAVGGGGINNFPVTNGAYDTRTTRHYSAFLSKFTSAGSDLEFSTFFGGIITEGYDISLGSDLAVDANGNSYVVGEANTYSAGIPLSQNAIVSDFYLGDFSYFLAVFNPDGSRLLYSTYLGVRDSRSSLKTALDGQGNLYIVGKTKESNFPATNGAFSTTYNGGEFDIFILKISVNEITGTEGNIESIPDDYVLSQNYPNPFNPSTTINYSVPTSNFITINVFNVLGEKIATLINEKQQPGNHSIVFDASELPGGVYFYELTTEGYRSVKKMVLIK